MKGGAFMAIKSANILARVEPDVKEQAESILNQLGIPVSVAINMLYKQIILTKSIPFSLSLPSTPRAYDEMTKQEFDEMMQIGLSQAKAGESRPAADVFAELKKEIQ